MGGKEAKKGGRAEKENHEGRKTDTKHGFIKGSGRGSDYEAKDGGKGSKKRQRRERSGRKRITRRHIGGTKGK